MFAHRRLWSHSLGSCTTAPPRSHAVPRQCLQSIHGRPLVGVRVSFRLTWNSMIVLSLSEIVLSHESCALTPPQTSLLYICTHLVQAAGDQGDQGGVSREGRDDAGPYHGRGLPRRESCSRRYRVYSARCDSHAIPRPADSKLFALPHITAPRFKSAVAALHKHLPTNSLLVSMM